MEDRRLKTFITVAQHGSFSRAAGVLYVTQSTVTTRIAELERELSTRLFTRVGRGVELTEAGRRFLPYAQRCLQSLEDGRVAVAAAASREGESKLRIMASQVPAAYDLPHLIKDLRSRNGGAAGLALQVDTDGSKRIFRRMLRGEADVALVQVRFRHPEVETVILAERPLAVLAATAPGNGPAGDGTPAPGPRGAQGATPAGEEGDFPVFFLQEELEDALAVRSLCHQLGLGMAGAVGLRDLHVLLQWVRQGLGLGVLPWDVARDEVAGGRLRVVAAEGPGAVQGQITCLMTHRAAREGPKGEAVRRFEEGVRRYYARRQGFDPPWT